MILEFGFFFFLYWKRICILYLYIFIFELSNGVRATAKKSYTFSRPLESSAAATEVRRLPGGMRWLILHAPSDYKTGKETGDRPPLVLAPAL